MFGYVMANTSKLGRAEFEQYQSYYCGLCKTLKSRFGKKGQITLNYDMTFLAIILTALYEPETKEKKIHCLLHPKAKHMTRKNVMVEYAADMNIALTYHKCKDDWQDEKSLKGFLGARLFEHKYKDIAKRYERQCQAMEKSLEELMKCEQRKENHLDTVSRCFGMLTEEIFVYKKDEWESSLRRIGFYLGKFIYLLDAYDDLERDKKTKSYNPLIEEQKKPEFEEYFYGVLTLMMAECAREIEKLPLITDTELLRNILYSGVWMKYWEIRRRKEKGDAI